MRLHAVRTALLAVVLATSAASPAIADDEKGAYPRLSVGAVIGAAPSDIDDNGETGAFVSGNMGVRFSDWLQWDVFDGSGFWSQQDLDSCNGGGPCDWDVDAMFFGSAVRLGYFKKPGDGDQLPNAFLIGGLGGGRLTSNKSGSDVSDWGIAGNVGAGVEIPFGEHFTAGVTYRFFAMGDELNGGTAKIQSIGFEFGWR